MNIILCKKDSTLGNSLSSIMGTNYNKVGYQENVNDLIDNLILIIDTQLRIFEDVILRKIRQANFIVGVWSDNSKEEDLPNSIKNLLDSLICKDNISDLQQIIVNKKKLLQTPECKELIPEKIIRVDCRTGRKLK